MFSVGRWALLMLVAGLVFGTIAYKHREVENLREAQRRFTPEASHALAEIDGQLQRLQDMLGAIRAAARAYLEPDVQASLERFEQFRTDGIPDRLEGLRIAGLMSVDNAPTAGEAATSPAADAAVRLMSAWYGAPPPPALLESIATRMREPGATTFPQLCVIDQATIADQVHMLVALPAMPARAASQAATGASSLWLIGEVDIPYGSHDHQRQREALQFRGALSAAELQTPESKGSAKTLLDTLSETRSMQAMGCEWQLRVTATDHFLEDLHQLSPKEAAGWTFTSLAAVALLLQLLNLGGRRHARYQLMHARKAAIVEGSEDAIIGETLDGRIFEWNSAAVRLFGYSREDALDRHAASIILPPDRADEDRELRSKVAAGQRVPPFQTVRRRQDGSLVPVAISAAPVLDSAGHCIGMAKSVRDISEELCTRDELVKLNSHLEDEVQARTQALDRAMRDMQSIIDAVPTLISYWDADLINRVANTAYEQWFGFEPGTMAGAYMPDVLGPVRHAAAKHAIEGALRGEAQSFQLTVPGGTDSDERHLLLRYLPDVVGGHVRGFYALVQDVTEVVSGKRQLADAERQREALLNTLNQHAIVSLADRRGRIIDVNDRFCAISGFSREQLLGQDHRVLNSGQHPRSFWQQMWRTLAKGNSWHGEVCNRAKDGSLYWVSSIVAPITDADGRIEQYISIRYDITEAKALEARLRSSEAFQARAGQLAGVGGWEIDLTTGEQMWSLQMHHIFETDGQIPPLDEALQCFPGEQGQALREAMTRCQLDGTPWDVEATLVATNGLYKHVRAVGTAVMESGRVVRVVGAVQDISTRHDNEAALRKTMTLLNAVLDSATQAAIVAVDPDGIVRVFNSGAEAMLGWQADELVGQQTFSVFHDRAELEERAEQLGAELDRHIEPRDVVVQPEVLGRPQAYNLLTRQGTRVPVSLAVTAMREPEGALYGYLGIAHDVSSLKQQEQLLLEAKRRAEHASEAKTQFLANMSHEIRTPMNAVVGLTYLLATTRLDADQTDYVEKIKSASNGLLALINDVLDVSKIEASELHLENRPFDVRGLLSEVSDLFTVQCQTKRIDFVVDTDAGVPEVLVGDALRLRQILTNLLSNAVKFTSEGAVTLAVRHLGSTNESASLAFRVRDSGVGISPDTLSKLFKPFVQADTSTTRRFGGTGLGLSIVKALAELMGGGIEVSSEPGRGSEFVLKVDLLLASEMPVEDDDLGESLEGALDGLRILVVDDSPMNLDVASRILSRAGATVQTASHGQEAVDVLARDTGACDVVLMDVQMPVLDGHDATRRIRTTLGLRHLPVIALTAGVTVGEKERSQAAGMNDIVGKPFDPMQLVRAIRRQLASTTVSGHPCDLADRSVTSTPARSDTAVTLVADATTTIVAPSPSTPVAATKPVPAPDQAVAPMGARPAATPSTSPASKLTPPAAARSASSSRDFWTRSFPNLDLAGAKRRFVGDQELFTKVLRNLLDEFGDLATAATTMPADLASLKGRLHSLKGLAGTTGATRLAEAAADAEQMIRQSQDHELMGALAAVAAALVELSETTAACCPSTPAPEPGAAGHTSPAPSDAAVDRQELAALMDRLRQFDLSALDQFKQLQPGLRQQLGGEHFDKLRKLLDDLHFSEAAQLIEREVAR